VPLRGELDDTIMGTFENLGTTVGTFLEGPLIIYVVSEFATGLRGVNGNFLGPKNIHCVAARY
jgi:hypothetical protein